MTQTAGSTFPDQGVDEFRLDGYVAVITGGGRGSARESRRGFRAGLVRTRPGCSDCFFPSSRGRGHLYTGDRTTANRSFLPTSPIYLKRRGSWSGPSPSTATSTVPRSTTPAVPCLPPTSTRRLRPSTKRSTSMFSAPFELTKRATPHLLASGRASVINITSRMDCFTARQMVIYGTVKAALSHMTRLFAVELAPGVRVNGIAPGVVDTDGLQAVLNDQVRQRIISATLSIG